MRRALLHFLLFSFLFNAAVGMPLHAAEHAHKLAAQHLLESVADRASSTGGAEATEEDDAPDVHTLCTLCASYAQQGNALGQGVASPLAVAERPRLPTPRYFLAFVPAAERWPFASRDPPL